MNANTMALEVRLARTLLTTIEFTADDVTDCGRVTIDVDHVANAKQNAIGSLFNAHARSGHIAFTGRVVRSSAPHRKGGSIRVWRSTDAGRRWARVVLDSVS